MDRVCASVDRRLCSVVLLVKVDETEELRDLCVFRLDRERRKEVRRLVSIPTVRDLGTPR